MSTLLEENLTTILNEKNIKIISENIKEGITIFDVVGALKVANEEKNVIVEPKTTKQVINPSEGYTGLENITVEAVTSEIDENIIATNIRSGINILGVEGNLEPDKPDQNKTVIPKTTEQTVEADVGYELAQVKIEAVTSDIDEHIQAENIKEGIEILGVTGTVNFESFDEYSVCVDLANDINGEII